MAIQVRESMELQRLSDTIFQELVETHIYLRMHIPRRADDTPAAPGKLNDRCRRLSHRPRWKWNVRWDGSLTVPYCQFLTY